MATSMEAATPESQAANNSKVSAKVGGTKSAWSQVVRGVQGLQATSDNTAANSDTSAPATPGSTSDVKKASTSPGSDPTPSTEESMSPQAEVDVSPKPVKQAWKKPSTSPGDAPVGAVMGAVSWPALGETSDHKSHDGQVDQFQAPTSPTTSESGEPSGAARRLNLQTDSAAAGERPVRYNGETPRPNAGGSRPYYQQGGGYQGNRRNTRDQGRNNWNTRNYVNSQGGGMPNRMRHYAPHSTTTYVNVNPGFINPGGPTGVYYVPTPAGAAPMHGTAGYYGLGLVPVPVPDHPTLKQMLLKQIEYYFSVDNLCRDIYLRRQMDDQGYVPVSLIATFNRIRTLTSDKNLILDALRESTALEIEGEKLRPKREWAKWLLNFNGATYAPENDAAVTPSIDNRADTVLDTSQQRVGAAAADMKAKVGGLSTAFGSMSRPSVEHDEAPDVYSHDHGEDDDVKDHDVQRLIIVTQGSGGWQTGIPDDEANTINDGLYFYEQELFENNGPEANGVPKLHSKAGYQRLFKTGSHTVAESPPNPVGFLFGATPPSNVLRPSASSLGASSANAGSVGSPPVGSVPKPFPRFQHPSHALLEKNGFQHQKYQKLYNRSLAERKRLGIGNSEEMNSLFRFWSYFLRTNFNRGMYRHFKSLAEEDFEADCCYGMECLFRFYSYGLEMKFRQFLYNDFEHLVLYTFKRGNLYGLEKYWAFHFYYKGEAPVKKRPELERLLTEEYRTLEDFHKASHGSNNEALMNGKRNVDDLHLATSRPTSISTGPATTSSSASIAVS